MLGSLFWAMADLWPGEPIQVAWSADAFVRPMINLGAGVGIAAVLGVCLLRFLPHGWVWDRLTVTETVGGSAQTAGGPRGRWRFSINSSGTGASRPPRSGLGGRWRSRAGALRPR